MIKIEIKSIFGKLLFVYEDKEATIKKAIEQAIKEKANLSSANLRSANLRSADLRSADLSSATNKETAIIPIYSKWSVSIKGDIIVIGCKQQTIAQWDEFFLSDREYDTKRDTEDFKRIQANYEAIKAYFNFLNK